MVDQPIKKVALIGNPNSGKSSLFNQLTGLNQKVGNFPGITVEKKSGICRLPEGGRMEIIDLPGTYSMYPKSADEQVVFDTLIDKSNPDHPDLVIVIIDASNIKRNLLLFTQVVDMGLPVILVLNMLDVATNRGQRVSPTMLSRFFDVPVISLNARTGHGIDLLYQAMEFEDFKIPAPAYRSNEAENVLEDEIKSKYGLDNRYVAHLALIHYLTFPRFSPKDRIEIKEHIKSNGFSPELSQSKEVIGRYAAIDKVIGQAVVTNLEENRNFTDRLDRIFTHRIFGYLIFFSILFLIFQSIFAWASAPMDFIDFTFSELSASLKGVLPAGVLTNLLTDGILPGIGGVVIFIPQIAILFAFIAILEETGYMSRVVFLMDRIMRNFGLNGKSIVPLISGWACAIPAIMATRTIDNWKERLITIFVIPFMSCSARLPVYTILIALVIPDIKVFGFLNVQGLVLMVLYVLGFLVAILSAAVMNAIMKIKSKGYFIMELPLYKFPRWKNVGFTILEKSKTFTFEAGKIILAISIILWVAATFGPGDHIKNAEKYVAESNVSDLNEEEFKAKVETYKLENSYAGIFGKGHGTGDQAPGF
ncbi:MAG: ferrous iron transport protein B [Cyclobacteriaceae bacterium]|nr:ferrous iron transport protein B [Cyclobacteriaceae bacterium]